MPSLRPDPGPGPGQATTDPSQARGVASSKSNHTRPSLALTEHKVLGPDRTQGEAQARAQGEAQVQAQGAARAQAQGNGQAHVQSDAQAQPRAHGQGQAPTRTRPSQFAAPGHARRQKSNTHKHPEKNGLYSQLHRCDVKCFGSGHARTPTAYTRERASCRSTRCPGQRKAHNGDR